MPSSDSGLNHGQLGVRLLSIYFIVRGLWVLTSNVLGSIPEFDPNYFGYYFYTQMLYPIVGIVLGSVLYVLAPTLGRRISK